MNTEVDIGRRSSDQRIAKKAHQKGRFGPTAQSSTLRTSAAPAASSFAIRLVVASPSEPSAPKRLSHLLASAASANGLHGLVAPNTPTYPHPVARMQTTSQKRALSGLRLVRSTHTPPERPQEISNAAFWSAIAAAEIVAVSAVLWWHVGIGNISRLWK